MANEVCLKLSPLGPAGGMVRDDAYFFLSFGIRERERVRCYTAAALRCMFSPPESRKVVCTRGREREGGEREVESTFLVCRLETYAYLGPTQGAAQRLEVMKEEPLLRMQAALSPSLSPAEVTVGERVFADDQPRERPPYALPLHGELASRPFPRVAGRPVCLPEDHRPEEHNTPR